MYFFIPLGAAFEKIANAWFEDGFKYIFVFIQVFISNDDFLFASLIEFHTSFFCPKRMN